MGTNPFDSILSSRKGGEGTKTLASLGSQIHGLVQQCDTTRRAHKEAWRGHKQAHHERRYEIALEREASLGRFIPPNIRAIKNAKDDAHFSYLKDYDQLLELKTHEEYLHGRRAWDRRHKIEDVTLNVTVQPEPAAPRLTGRKVWGLCVLIFVLFLDLCALLAGPAGLLFVFVSPLIWVCITMAPLIAEGTFSGGRGNNGTAV